MPDVQDRLGRALAGRYEIQQELGRGGMATVYVAKDLKHHRVVALKVLRPELATVVGSERFLREVRIAAQLSHPHILAVLDSGEAEGLLYYAMPLVQGESLRDRLQREGPLSLEVALRITHEVAEALAHAHSHGMVHRDIKPENILLAGDHAVVADFGVARVIGDSETATRLTETGVAVGTPAYMSPDHWSGAKVDGRADQYSLACTLYEMLVGEPPFTGPNVQVVLARHSMEMVPSVRIARATVPEGVEAAIMKAMSKLPADRFTTTYEFSSALAAAAVAAPTQPTGAVRRLPVAPPRRRWPLIGMGVLSGLLAAVAAFSLWGRAPADAGPAPRRVVVAMLENRTGDASLDQLGSMAADWITVGLQQTGVLEVVPSVTALQASRFLAAELLAGRIVDPVRALSEETGAGTVIAGAYYKNGDSLLFQVEVVSAATRTTLGSLQPVGGSASSPVEAMERLRARIMGLLAVRFDERLATEATIARRPPTFEAYRAFAEGLERYIAADYRNALPALRRAFAADTAFASALLYAAFCHSNLGDPISTDTVARRVATHRDRLSEHDRAWLEYLQAQIAGDRERALHAIARAASIAPGSKAAYNLAYVALQTNRPREALAALKTLEPERGPMRGWFPYWTALGNSLHRLGDHRAELEAARQARRLFPDRTRAMLLEGAALAALGREEDVAALAEEAVAKAVTDPAPGAFMAELGDELLAHGHAAAARDMFTRTLRWFEIRPPAEFASEGNRAARAGALENLERPADAENVVRDLLRERPDNFVYQGWLGHLRGLQGDRAAASQAAEKLAGVRGPYLFGAPALQQARIAAVIGERNTAVALLREALGQGLPFPNHFDRYLASLSDYAPFKELTAPRDGTE